jgi:mRNA interferase HigB
MWVVSLKRLREFWTIHPRAEVSLRAWYSQAAAAEWQGFADLRTTFASADLVGNCTVFNIGGNNYRLIGRLFYSSHKLYILRVMTHREYDRQDWKSQCGCFRPQPGRARSVSPKRRMTR